MGIDLVINNAGRGKLGRLLDHGLEEAGSTVELNVVTPLVLTRAFLPDMLARARAEGRRAGLIIVSSTAAFAPLPYFATYAASKAFDHVLAERLAEELSGEPVDVLALCPGATRTEFRRRAGLRSKTSRGRRIRARSPRRRSRRSAGVACWSAVGCAALLTRPSPCHAQSRPAVSAVRLACSAHGSPKRPPARGSSPPPLAWGSRFSFSADYSIQTGLQLDAGMGPGHRLGLL
jgi:NAD(P)-dependent dehydrogenase (short-subunit alcohol dehydrogenase family)